MNTIAANIAAVREKIARACREAGRDSGAVNLVAASKLQAPDRITEALEAGQRLFGENRVQEAKARWITPSSLSQGERAKVRGYDSELSDIEHPHPTPSLREGEIKRQTLRSLYPGLKLHLIGPLQTNKARDAVALFDCIETVDRPDLADALAKEMAKQTRRIPCFVQVNTGEEPQKGGVVPNGLPALLDHCRKAGLEISGLMCIPPADDPPSPHFALLKKLATRHGLADLSMGMSRDYEEAIALGATYIRIGTALFGERAP